MNDVLWNLAQTWRKQALVDCVTASEVERAESDALDRCADELEAALSSAGGGEAVAFDPSRPWPGLDHTLTLAYQAGMQGETFDMIAARKAVHAATAPTPQAQGERDGRSYDDGSGRIRDWRENAWTDDQCLAFAATAFRHAPKNLPTGVTLDDIRLGSRSAIRAAQQPKGAGQ